MNNLSISQQRLPFLAFIFLNDDSSRCGDSYSGHQHTYTETVTEPTCEQDGYTTYTCSCGYSYTDNVVPALGHDYVLAGQDETIWTYACTRCGLSYTVVAPIVPEPPVEYGLRNSNVTVTTEHHDYVYASGTLLRETITTTDAEGNATTETLDFVYDLNGSPYALNYTNGAAATQTYYYITNVQGDVTHLVTADGEVVAEYGYDAWGKVTAATGSMAEVNPLRYRGYYADAELEVYYVSSRYYDPAVCRFINADEAALIGANGDFVSLNLFAYCGNSPVARKDQDGEFWNVVIGAAIGAAFAVITEVAVAVITQEPIDVKDLAAAAVGGATSGALQAVGISPTVANAVGEGAKAAASGFFNGDSVATAIKDSLVATTKALAVGAVSGAGKKIANKILGGKFANLGKIGQKIRRALREPRFLDTSAPSTICSNFVSKSAGRIGKAAASCVFGEIF